MSERRELPEGYAEFARGKRRRELCAHYGTSTTTISRWNVEAGVGRPPRPVVTLPEDFSTFAPGKSARELAAHYRVSNYTICKWRRVLGIPGHDRGNLHRRHWRHCPPDFAKHAHESNSDLSRRYRAGLCTLKRWRQEAGIRGIPGNDLRPVPDDFAEVGPTMCRRYLIQHYRCGVKTLDRWICETGVEPACYIPPRAEPKKAEPRQRTAKIITYRGPKQPAVPPRDWTLHGQAAEHLRRHAPTYRCNERGTADQHGEFYRYGNVVMTPDEMLKRAERLGWQRERWAA